MLRNRIRDLDATIVNHYQSGEKDQAFWLLRKKGLLQTQLSRVDGYLYRVLGVISDNEMAQVSKIFVSGSCKPETWFGFCLYL